MASQNLVILIGNLGADPEIKSFSNGGKIANLRVACSESWKDKQTGEKRERTEWVPVVVQSDGAATFCERYLRKGDTVHVVGQFRTRKWQDRDGNDRYSTEVVVNGYSGQVQSLMRRDDRDGRGGGERDNRRDDGHGTRGGGGQAQGSGYGSGGRPGGGGQYNDLDDEIPFAPEVRA